MSATTPTFADVLRAQMQRLHWPYEYVAALGGITPQRLSMILLFGAQPTEDEVILLALRLGMSGGAWHDFLAAAGVATEAGGGA